MVALPVAGVNRGTRKETIPTTDDESSVLYSADYWIQHVGSRALHHRKNDICPLSWSPCSIPVEDERSAFGMEEGGTVTQAKPNAQAGPSPGHDHAIPSILT